MEIINIQKNIVTMGAFYCFAFASFTPGKALVSSRDYLSVLI
jgi:hypothetical protein